MLKKKKKKNVCSPPNILFSLSGVPDSVKEKKFQPRINKTKQHNNKKDFQVDQAKGVREKV